jgi:hypothetical protein
MLIFDNTISLFTIKHKDSDVTLFYLCGIKRARILDSDERFSLTMLVDLIQNKIANITELNDVTLCYIMLPLRDKEGSNPGLRWMSCFGDAI